MEKIHDRRDRLSRLTSVFALASSLIFGILLGPSSLGADRFIRGRAAGQGDLSLTDPIAILGHLFLGGPGIGCLDADDADDSRFLDLTDPIFLLQYLFLGGQKPADPFPACGGDPTPDGLGCEEFLPCP